MEYSVAPIRGGGTLTDWVCTRGEALTIFWGLRTGTRDGATLGPDVGHGPGSRVGWGLAPGLRPRPGVWGCRAKLEPRVWKPAPGAMDWGRA